MIKSFVVALLLCSAHLLSAQDPCTNCEVMPLLEKYNQGNESDFAKLQLSKASLSQYLSATAKVEDGDYTITLLLDAQGNPSIESYIYNGRDMEDENVQTLIQVQVDKFHVLNSWTPAEVDLVKHPSKLTIAFDKKTKVCPEALYSLRSLVQEGACNQYFCSKKDLIEIFDYYDSDLDGWNYIGDKEKDALKWTIYYPGKKDLTESVVIDQTPTEEQFELIKKKLPKKGKIEIERSMYGTDTRHIAVILE